MITALKKSPFFWPFSLATVFYFISGLVLFLLPVYFASVGFTSTQIGIFIGASGLTSLLVEFGVGVLTDRVLIRRITIVGFLLSSAYLFGASTATTFWLMLFVFIVRGLGFSSFELSVESFTIKQAEKAHHIGWFHLFRVYAFAAGAILGGYLLFSLDFPLVLRLGALIYIIAAVFAQNVPKTKLSTENLAAYVTDFFRIKVLFFAFLIFLFTMHWGIEQTMYGLFLQHHLSLNLFQSGLYIGLAILSLGVAAVWFGHLYDRGMHAHTLLLYAFLFSGLGFAGTALTTNVWLSFLSRFVHEFGDGIFILFIMVGTKSFFEEARLGGNYGLIRVVALLGLLSGAFVYGPVADVYGYAVPHIVAGFVIALLCVFVPLFRH